MTTAAADRLIGTVIAGRYEVVRKVAKGGMGMIYEVRNTRLGRSFALKTITADAAQDPEVLARFRREADVVAKLSHPNIVEVVDWDQLDDGAPFLVMEYLRGESLADRIDAIGPVPWPQIARIADEVLSALGVAHRAGVVHRDLKPDNIFLATDDAGEERVKLLDFGISKIRDSQTFQTTDAKVLGTPAYMAPEQAEGRHDEIGPATDVWAIGAILYEMITGKVAFEAPSTPAILYRVCHGRPDPAAEKRPDMPPGLNEILDWALDVQLRLDDVEELRLELRRVFADVEGVTWAAPMMSRVMDAVRNTPGAFPRLSTPHPVPRPSLQRAASRPAPVAPEPVVAQPPAATPKRSRRGLWLGLGAVGFAGTAFATFLAVRGRGDATPTPAAPTAASVVPAAPAATPPAAPAQPPTVAVAIDSKPVGAEVYRFPSEVKVGVTPWSTKLERGDGVVVFVIRAPDHEPARVEIDLREGGTVTAELVPVKKKTGDRPKTRPTTKPPTPPTGTQRKQGEPINPFDPKPKSK